VACGAPLPAGLRRDAERKPVTVLFCDLVGFTSRSDRADPEDVKATLRPFHARIVRELENHGGTLDAFAGDAVIGVFGAPVSHEDDPERAVRAAFRIQDAIDELNEQHPALALATRIGIDTGDAVVALGPGPQVGERVTGEVLERAAALQAVAPAGGIAVGEATHRATRELFAFERLDPASLPGRSTALEAWRPIALSRLVRERPTTPFVGRDEESALLRAAFRRALNGPSVQLVTVVGEPGVGKSRLVQELAGHLDREPEMIRWRVGRARPYGEGVAFAPIADIVKAESGVLDSDTPSTVSDKLAKAVDVLVEEPAEAGWLRARLAPLLGLGEVAGADRVESFTAWRRVLEAMAAQHPTVLVFEDLHWADPALLDLLDEVVVRSSDLPLLVLCVARPELYERRPSWGGGKRNATTISLHPLSEREISMLVSALLDPAALSPETRAALLERAGGNPLYAEEFARMLAEGGPQVGREIAVPDSIQALIAARLDTLSPDAKTLLLDAAVLGPEIWQGALVAMGGCTPAEVATGLHELVRQELLRPVRPSSIAGDAEFAFWHVLVRDVAYDQIPRSERAGKHRAAADWVAGVAGERGGEQAELLAHHYGIAAELAGEALDDDLRDKAAMALTLAGTRARRLDAEAAARAYAKALALLPEDHPERPSILVRAADTDAAIGRFAESRAAFEEAVDRLRAVGDRRRLAEALAYQSRTLHRVGDPRRANRLLEEAAELLEHEDPGPEHARVYTRMAGNAIMSGWWERGRDLAERALVLAERFGLVGEEVRALQFLGAARCELGEPQGLADLWAAVRRGTQAGLGEETMLAYGNLAFQLWLRDGPTIGLQAWTSAREFSEVRGFATNAMWSRAGQIEVLFDLGRWDEVVQGALELEAWDREQGGGQLGVIAATYRGLALAYRGWVPEATLLAEELLPRLRVVELVELVAPGLVAGAVIETQRGHVAMAGRLIDEFLERTAEHPGFRWQHLPEMLRLRLRHDPAAEVASMLPAAEPIPTRYRNDRATCEALLAESRGDLAAASERWADAAQRWSMYGSVLELAHARFGRGRCLAALGERDAALEELREARERFGSLGAGPLVAEVDRAIAGLRR